MKDSPATTIAALKGECAGLGISSKVGVVAACFAIADVIIAATVLALVGVGVGVDVVCYAQPCKHFATMSVPCKGVPLSHSIAAMFEVTWGLDVAPYLRLSRQWRSSSPWKAHRI